MKQTMLFFSAIIVVVLLFSQQAVNVKSLEMLDENPHVCRSIDAVILVDQSGSMEKLNDRGGFRILATKDILQRFGLNTIIDCPEAYHRIAVVNFGSTVESVDFFSEPTAPWVQLGGYGYDTDLNAWKTNFSTVSDKIVLLNLGDTNVLGAMQMATQLLHDMGAAPLSALTVDQAIILITDGMPYPQPDEQLDDVSVVLSDTPDTKFWVVALSQDLQPYLDTPIEKSLCHSGSDMCTLRSFWSEIAQSHGGDLRSLTRNENEIPDTLNEIYDELLGQGGVTWDCGQPSFIEPYTASATITISKRSSEVQVWLQDEKQGLKYAGGRVYLGDSIIEDFAVTNGMPASDGTLPRIRFWTSLDQAERYVLAQPNPGSWRVTATSCPDVRVRFSPLSVTASFLEPSVPLAIFSDPPYYDENDSHLFRIGVEDSAGNPVANNPDFPLKVTLVLTDPQGNSISPAGSTDSKWILNAVAPGVWQASDKQPVPVQYAGIYKVAIRGTAISSDPSQPERVVFENDNLSYSVLDVRGFKFEIVTPAKTTPSVTIPLNRYESLTRQSAEPIKIAVQLMAKGKNLGQDGVIISESPFYAILKNSNGDSLEEIELLPANNEGRYEGVFRSNGDIVDPPGDYVIEVNFVGQWDSAHWQPSITSDTVQISRYPVEFADYVIHYILTDLAVQRTILAIFSAIVLAFLFWVIWSATGRLSGTITLYKKEGARWEDLDSFDLRKSLFRRSTKRTLTGLDKHLGKLRIKPIVSVEIDYDTNKRRNTLSGINLTITDYRGKIVGGGQLSDNDADEFVVQYGKDVQDEYRVEYHK